MILTPEQIDSFGYSDYKPDRCDLEDTLAVYADIVERVADMGTVRLFGHADWCVFCHQSLSPLPRGGFALESDHAPDCPYLAARKLRGKE